MERKHGPWTVRSSERLYADEFAEVWVDEVSRPGVEPSRRVTMRMKPGVAVLALDGEGFAHLVRTFRYAVGKECVEVVQGGRAIWSGRLPRLMPGRSTRIPHGWTARVDPAAGEVRVRLSQRG